MQSEIRVLDENTINKIAAGEVIENPSSVVKELVDNSIDAGATEISIEVSGGGRQLIRVTDNGKGMSPDDAVLCLERHATSKIKSVDDILTIHSMGFRGEAIPSIASVSKFNLLTSSGIDGEKGTMVIVDGGKIVKVCEAARSRGTTIEVKSLFFNVPVRRKFQRSPNYDSQEILKMLIRLAIANPEIKIELISNQKYLLETKKPMGNEFPSILSERIGDVLGDEFINQCFPVENVYEGIEVYGVIGFPSNTRHNRTGQHVFINRRPVFSPLVQHAVREGYSSTLPTNRHPLFVLHILLTGDLVDVNVHPQKKEVRLRQEQTLKRAVTQAVDRALHGSGFVPISIDVPSTEENSISIFEQKGFAGVPVIHENIFQEDVQHFVKPESPQIFSTPSRELSERIIPEESVQEVAFIAADELSKKPKPIVIGTIPGYIILEGHSIGDDAGGLILVDQKAAHSRIIYESILKETRSGAVEIQQLLVPVTLELNSEESVILKKNISVLSDLGIKIREFGKNSFLIDAVPTIFGEIDFEALVREFIHSITSDNQVNIGGEIERKLASEASRLSLPRAVKMHSIEAQALVERLFLCKHPYQSPTGKNTLTTFNQQELSKRF
ncbi:MAG: DNA mismatch repair endonuclease MutL [Bacteroidota bacterium]